METGGQGASEASQRGGGHSGGYSGREELETRGLKVHWTPKQALARGVGGAATVCGVVEMPLGL